MHQIDVFPTLAALAGAEGPPSDGTDLSGLLLNGEAPATRALYWHFPAYLEGQSDRFDRFRTTPGGAVRVGDWKLVEYFEPLLDGASHVELYDLGNDRRERRDLAALHPERTATMHARLREWRRGVSAPVPVAAEQRYRAASEAESEGDGAR